MGKRNRDTYQEAWQFTVGREPPRYTEMCKGSSNRCVHGPVDLEREDQTGRQRHPHWDTHIHNQGERGTQMYLERTHHSHPNTSVFQQSLGLLQQPRAFYNERDISQEERKWSSLKKDKVFNSALVGSRTSLFPGFQRDLKGRASPSTKETLPKGGLSFQKE